MEEEVYYTNNKNKSSKEDWMHFFEYQTIIMEDINRIAYKVSDYREREERKQLLVHLHQISHDISKYYFDEDLEENAMDLEIKITEKYLAFSYYKLDKVGQRLTNKPSIVLISRNMQNLYFIDEKTVLIKNCLEEDIGLCNEYEDYSLYHLELYELGQREITREEKTFESYTHDVVYPCFYETEKMVEKIKTMY